MTIRPYRPADKPGCLEAFKSNMPRFFAAHELDDYAAWLDTLGDGSEDRYFVMEEQGGVIGCGGFYVNKAKQSAIMAWGLISNAHHKRGLGKELLTFRLNEIRRMCPFCTIVLDTTQHSYPFFEKLGFRVTKVTADFYGVELHRYDMERLPGE